MQIGVRPSVLPGICTYAALAGSMYFEVNFCNDMSENIYLFYQGYIEDNVFILHVPVQ